MANTPVPKVHGLQSVSVPNDLDHSLISAMALLSLLLPGISPMAFRCGAPAKLIHRLDPVPRGGRGCEGNSNEIGFEAAVSTLSRQGS